MSERCGLCYGDGWITDSLGDLNRLEGEGESRRFKERMGVLTGAAEGRMACPRCQPDWTGTPLRKVEQPAKWWQFWK